MKNKNQIFPLLAAVIAALAVLPLSAQVPNLLNYQGRVAVSGINFEGSGQFKFALVNTDGTTAYWSNDGSSAAGSEPAAAVTLPIAKGLYSVALGDTTLPHMAAIPLSVFRQPDLRLRVWFNDGTNGSHLLTPDSRITPSGYLPDSSVTSEKIAPGAITGTQLGSGLTLSGTTAGTFSGNLSGNAETATNASNLTAQLASAGAINSPSNPVDWSQLQPEHMARWG